MSFREKHRVDLPPGPGVVRLVRYNVTGWAAPDWPMKKDQRIPLTRPEVIEAPNAEAALRTYARIHQIQENWWNDGSTKPRIVIRVEKAR